MEVPEDEHGEQVTKDKDQDQPPGVLQGAGSAGHVLQAGAGPSTSGVGKSASKRVNEALSGPQNKRSREVATQSPSTHVQRQEAVGTVNPPVLPSAPPAHLTHNRYISGRVSPPVDQPAVDDAARGSLRAEADWILRYYIHQLEVLLGPPEQEISTLTHLHNLHSFTQEVAMKIFENFRTLGNVKFFDQMSKELQQDMQTYWERMMADLALRIRNSRNYHQNAKKGPVVGIDLGTTSTSVAVYEDEEIKYIRNAENGNVTPSCVYFGASGTLVGAAAQRWGVIDPANCVTESKRLLGMSFCDPLVQEVTKKVTYNVVNSGVENQAGIALMDHHTGQMRSVLPDVISAELLMEMKRIAEAALECPVEDAVVTIPSQFSDAQRAATLRACAAAGLNVLQLLDEPKAVALAYGLKKPEKACTYRVLVFNFGAGTCDISLLEHTKNGMIVKAHKEDNWLGGTSYDDALTAHFTRTYPYPTDISGVKLRSWELRLNNAFENAKHVLSTQESYTVEVPDFDATGGISPVTFHLTRATFEELTKELSERAMTLVTDCMEEAGVTSDEIDVVVLAGGSSRLPKVQEKLRQIFSHEKLYSKMDPDLAIVTGAAVQAAILTNQLEVPIAVAEVTSTSLGVGVDYNQVSIIIPKSTAVPCSFTQDYYTARDFQVDMTIRVYQGEDEVNPREDSEIAVITIQDITVAPKKQTAVEVTFAIDHRGMLEVTAKERNKNNKRSLLVKKSVI